MAAHEPGVLRPQSLEQSQRLRIAPLLDVQPRLSQRRNPAPRVGFELPLEFRFSILHLLLLPIHESEFRVQARWLRLGGDCFLEGIGGFYIS